MDRVAKDAAGDLYQLYLEESKSSIIRFWRSVDLTGNQTDGRGSRLAGGFWRSVDLTGNQT